MPTDPARELPDDLDAATFPGKGAASVEQARAERARGSWVGVKLTRPRLWCAIFGHRLRGVAGDQRRMPDRRCDCGYVVEAPDYASWNG